MALKVVWTKQAEKGLLRVIRYLEEEWSSKEILRLEKNINAFIKKIIRFPNIYPSTKANESLRKGRVDENNYIVYRLNKNKNCIEVINFRSFKQKPFY